MKKKPDNVVDSPLTMPYGTNVGAPAFQVPDVAGYKKELAAEASHRFHQRYNEIEQEFKELVDQAQYNDRILNAYLSFKPNIGEIYHLYEQEGSDFVSMLSPQDWGESYMKNKSFVGSFKLKADNVWERIMEEPNSIDYCYPGSDPQV